MRLILFDLLDENRYHFYPLALGRPIWELRCGITSLREKLVAAAGTSDVACFVPPYMEDHYRNQVGLPVNDASQLGGDDLLLVHGRLKADGLKALSGPSQVATDGNGQIVAARINQADLAKLETASIESLLESARANLPAADVQPATWDYTWDLVLENPAQLTRDFQALGNSGVEGSIEEPKALRGSTGDVFVAPGARVHPMVVLDASGGPIYIDEEAEVFPFTRVEGPCYLGRKSMLLGANCREGNSIGPVCRVGGEVEESIIHGYSNKYHDGFLGHAYVGQWVNLGAFTTNSDLKNDYTNVSIALDGKRPIDTGSTKVGALIGDHTKTSIGTLFNTGSFVGAMALIAATGKPLPKYIPSFAWFLEGVVTKGFGRKKLYETARIAMSRRKCEWTPAEESLWEAVFQMTKPERDPIIKIGRRMLANQRG
ncbi:MAG: putative sugar nucleotidyl transferase [Thermoguttaceae bacterium]|jgi:UDP-N-acetylglucosamine diphosphorylase/glucosamine-1-phosphate N-acetyltransferase|nr:putative sugar nucleotidyl transferase [Thermoguttaceae bacterium]